MRRSRSSSTTAEADAARLKREAVLERTARVKFAALYPPHGPVPVALRVWRGFLAVTLAPVRLVCALVIAVSLVVWIRLCTVGLVVWDDESASARHLSPTRRRLIQGGVRATARWLLRLFHVSVKVAGREHIPKDPTTSKINIVANHISALDSLYIVAVFSPAFMSKAEVRSWCMVGTVATALECVFLDREKNVGGAATAKLVAIQNRADRGNVAIFPEGTTSNDRYLLAFRTGAFVAGQPVHPVCLRYPFAWTSPMFGESLPGTILKLAACWSWTLEATHLPRYDPSDAERADPALYARNVRRSMADAMRNPPVLLTNLRNDELNGFWRDRHCRRRPLTDLITDADVETYAHQEPHLMVPTAQARRAAQTKVRDEVPPSRDLL